MATQSAGHQVLRVAIDFGTTKTAVSANIDTHGQLPAEDTIQDVVFTANVTTSPQLMALNGQDIIWGHELEAMLRRDQIRYDKVISYLKLAFYKKHATSVLAQQAMEKVELLREELIKGHPEWDVYDTKVLLLAKYIKSIVEFAKESLESKMRMKACYGEGTIRKMPVELFLSVPGMWLPPGNRNMLEAANLAGFSKVEIVLEPQAQTAHWAHKLAVQPGFFNAGDQILIHDGGGGTSDSVLYELKTDDNTGFELQLEAVGDALGELCGSEFINEQFLLWLDADLDLQGRDKQKLFADLNCSASEFQYKASKDFDRLKVVYDAQAIVPSVVRVAGNPGGTMIEYTVTLQNDQIWDFFEPVLQENFALIRRLLNTKVKALVIAGGLSLSTYFMDRLREEFKTSNIMIDSAGVRAIGGCNPVTRGTLLKYHEILPRNLPTTDCFGISEDQVYDRGVHDDLVDVFGNAQPPRPQARSSPYYRDDYAKSRWRTIVPDGNRVRRSIWQLRTVRLREEERGDWVQGEKNIRIQVFWSAKQRDENSPIYTENDGEQLCEGIEKFGAPLCIELPDLAKENFPLKQPDLMPGKKLPKRQHGICRACRIRRIPAPLWHARICQQCAEKEFWEVYYRLELTFSGANIYFCVEFAKPEKNEAVAHGEQLGPNDVIRMGGQALLISESQNPNPRV